MCETCKEWFFDSNYCQDKSSILSVEWFFKSKWKKDFEIEIRNTDDGVHNMLEFVDIAGEYV